MARDNAENELQKKIKLRAYEIYRDRGGEHGRDLDDWLQAEAEIAAEDKQKKTLYSRKRAVR